MPSKDMHKIPTFQIKPLKDSGIISIIVLWIMVILSMMVISLSRSTHIELALAKYAVAKAKSKAAAWAVVRYAVELIRQDSATEESSNMDTLYMCGLSPAAAQNTEIRDHHGMTDEERKINLNALTPQNYKVLSSLIELMGYDKETAQIVAMSTVDWIDSDEEVSDEKYGAEHDYYTKLEKPYRCKNKPFDSLEEILLVRGMTEKLLKDLKPYVTIYPQVGTLMVNLDTASKDILKAFAYASLTEEVNQADADALVDKLMQVRAGADGIEGTSDDKIIEDSPTDLNAKESLLFTELRNYRAKRSDYLRIRAEGKDDTQGIITNVEAIINRWDLRIVSWRRDRLDI